MLFSFRCGAVELWLLSQTWMFLEKLARARSQGSLSRLLSARSCTSSLARAPACRMHATLRNTAAREETESHSSCSSSHNFLGHSECRSYSWWVTVRPFYSPAAIGMGVYRTLPARSKCRSFPQKAIRLHKCRSSPWDPNQIFESSLAVKASCTVTEGLKLDSLF